jgi:hypothetical protein
MNDLLQDIHHNLLRALKIFFNLLFSNLKKEKKQLAKRRKEETDFSRTGERTKTDAAKKEKDTPKLWPGPLSVRASLCMSVFCPSSFGPIRKKKNLHESISLCNNLVGNSNRLYP